MIVTVLGTFMDVISIVHDTEVNSMTKKRTKVEDRIWWRECANFKDFREDEN